MWSPARNDQATSSSPKIEEAAAAWAVVGRMCPREQLNPLEESPSSNGGAQPQDSSCIFNLPAA
jgi:hypothetical protein